MSFQIFDTFYYFQTNFSAIYDKAQAECYLICVPQSECLRGAVMTEKFVSKCIFNLHEL